MNVVWKVTEVCLLLGKKWVWLQISSLHKKFLSVFPLCRVSISQLFSYIMRKGNLVMRIWCPRANIHGFLSTPDIRLACHYIPLLAGGGGGGGWSASDSKTFSDQNGERTDQVPICLGMNPIGFLLCPSKSFHAGTECLTKTQSLFPALPVPCGVMGPDLLVVPP